MLQRIGFVSGMESNRELTALRVEIAGIDIIVIGDPAVICALIEHADQLIADGYGVFEENIGLRGIESELGRAADGSDSISADLFSIDAQVISGTDDLDISAEQVTVCDIEPVTLLRRFGIQDRADICRI